MEQLRPDFTRLTPTHSDNVNTLFEDFYVLYFHSQKQGKFRNGVQRRQDFLAIGKIDSYFDYPLTNEVISICNQCGVSIPDNNKIKSSEQGKLNKQLGNLHSSHRLQIEHVNERKELIQKFQNLILSEDMEFGIKQLKDIWVEHTLCFYRLRYTTKSNGTPVNGTTQYTLEESLIEIER